MQILLTFFDSPWVSMGVLCFPVWPIVTLTIGISSIICTDLHNFHFEVLPARVILGVGTEDPMVWLDRFFSACQGCKDRRGTLRTKTVKD